MTPCVTCADLAGGKVLLDVIGVDEPVQPLVCLQCGAWDEHEVSGHMVRRHKGGISAQNTSTISPFIFSRHNVRLSGFDHTKLH